MSCRAVATLSTVLLLLTACSDVAPSLPTLTAVTPARIRSLTPVQVELTGAHLLRRYRVDFNRSDGGSAVGEMAVSLRASDGTLVATTVIEHRSDSALRLELPAGLAPGSYDVVLTDPWSREAVLEDGLRVMQACEEESGPEVGQPCDGPDEDFCPDDTYLCTGTVMSCSAGASNAELCDGQDNDCNPATADGAEEPGLGSSCDGPDGDLCSDDQLSCAGVAGIQCSAGATETDLCDGADNDCNPATADGSAEPTLGQSCDGPDSDACSTDDTFVCNGAAGLQCSTSANDTELCDGDDNDCRVSTADGADEPLLSTACDGTDSDACLDDAYFCSATGMRCSDGTHSREACDGADNDCRSSTADGADETWLGTACDSPADTDLCAEDSYVCSGGGQQCPSANPSLTDLCDGSDNDCNPATADGSANATFGQPCDGPNDADSCADGVWACGGSSGMFCNDGPTSVGCPPLVDVGAFTQSPGSGNVQTVPHSLGELPKLLIIWTTGSSGTATGYLASVGLVDQSRASRASAATRTTTTQTSRYIANKAIALINAGGAIVAEATLTGWTSTGFSLTWNTATTSTRLFQFLAVGGTDVRSILKTWQMRTSVGTSTQTGLGFTPTGVVHLSSGYSFTSTPPAALSTAHLSLAATDGTTEFTAGIKALDGANPTDTSRAMRSSRCFIGWLADLSYDMEASCTGAGAFGAGSFAVNFVDPPPNPGEVSSLALAGLRVKATCFAKPEIAASPGAPITADITGVGFQPLAVLFATNNTELATGPVNLASFSIGATTAAEDVASSLIDANGVSTPDAASYANNSASFLRYDTAGTLVSSAEVSAMLADGFRLRFTQNTTGPADICYLALGAP